MEQLISTPVKPSELIVGKLIPYFFIGFADTLWPSSSARSSSVVPLRGSIALLLFVSAIFLFGGLSFGILISIAARNQLVASQIAMLTSFLPSFMLSGFIFTISNMPGPLQAITYVVPARYFVSVLKGVFLKGVGLGSSLLEVLFLSLYAVVVFLVANRKFRKRIEIDMFERIRAPGHKGVHTDLQAEEAGLFHLRRAHHPALRLRLRGHHGCEQRPRRRSSISTGPRRAGNWSGRLEASGYFTITHLPESSAE